MCTNLLHCIPYCSRILPAPDTTAWPPATNCSVLGCRLKALETNIFRHGRFFGGMLERAHAARQAEVADLEFAIGIDEQVARFEVPMDDMG